MAITYPYPLTYLADDLTIIQLTWDIRRNDELSGTGDGRVWSTELAPPLWMATVSLKPGYHDEGKQLAAKFRKLQGSQQEFYLYDPMSKYPQADKKGTILGSSAPVVSGINTARNSMSISGLPANYVLTIGDKMQINYGTNRTAFLEVSETITASALGATPLFEVFPYVPPGIANGTAVILARPACKMILMPGTYNPGTAAGKITSGSKFEAIQKK